MKCVFLLLISCLSAGSFYAQNGQLLNRGFENWTNETAYEYPLGWGSASTIAFGGNQAVFKSTDAHTGSASIELRAVERGDDNFYGLVYKGEANNSGPQGGIPYSSTFNKISFQYKADFATGDSLYVMVIRYNADTITEQTVYAVADATTSAWTEGVIDVSETLQEELFMGFLTFNPSNDAVNSADSWVRIDEVRLYNETTLLPLLPENGFEAWLPQSVENPDNWYTWNDYMAGTGVASAVKTTDARTGTYAIQLSTIYVPEYDDVIPAKIALTDLWESTYAVPYVASPTLFSGSYKFTASAVGSDEAIIELVFYKNGEYIGGEGIDVVPTTTYIDFSVPLILSDVPDSMNFNVFSGSNEGAVMVVDDLSISGGTVGVEQFEKSGLSLYPNPAIDQLMIKAAGVYEWQLLNTQGAVVTSGHMVSGVQTIATGNLAAGTYFIQFINNQTTEVHKVVIQ